MLRSDDDERMKDLEDELDEAKSALKEAQDELKLAPTLEDLRAMMTEQECRRCHARYIGLDSQRYCTRDCEMGWTPAPTYEQWYRTLHPDHDFSHHVE